MLINNNTCKPQEFKTLDYSPKFPGVYQISPDKSIQSSICYLLFLKTLGCTNGVLEYQVKMEEC